MAVCACEISGVEACSPTCTCRIPVLSGGCSRCATHGSASQQLRTARRIAEGSADGSYKAAKYAQGRVDELLETNAKLEAEVGRLSTLKNVYSTDAFDLQTKMRDMNLQFSDLLEVVRKCARWVGKVPKTSDECHEERAAIAAAMGALSGNIPKESVEQPKQLDRNRCYCAGSVDGHCKMCGYEPCTCVSRSQTVRRDSQ